LPAQLIILQSQFYNFTGSLIVKYKKSLFLDNQQWSNYRNAYTKDTSSFIYNSDLTRTAKKSKGDLHNNIETTEFQLNSPEVEKCKSIYILTLPEIMTHLTYLDGSYYYGEIKNK
jgi:protein tyrosine phosphatase